MKQSQMNADPTISKIRVALLGYAEVFGFEECQPTDAKLRKDTIICNKSDSVCFFISLQDFKERVVGDKVTLDIEIEA